MMLSDKITETERAQSTQKVDGEDVWTRVHACNECFHSSDDMRWVNTRFWVAANICPVQDPATLFTVKWNIYYKRICRPVISLCSDRSVNAHRCQHPSLLVRGCWVSSREIFFEIETFARLFWRTQKENKKLIRRWDSERELSLRRRRTRTTKYRLVHKFRHRSTRRLCVGTYVYQIQ